MKEQSQPTPTDNLPHFHRVVTFLANCGLHFCGLKFSWFDQKRHLFCSLTHPHDQYINGRFDASDEIILMQQVQAAVNTNILVGKVFANARVYSLNLDQGHYRLRYSLTSTGRQQLIGDLLAEKGITQYELTGEESEGRLLPPYQNFGKIESCSGKVVTLTAVYGFWLGWANGRHTLGEERTFWVNGKERSFWNEYTLDDILPHGKYPGIEQEVEEARQRLHLRRQIGGSQSNGTSEIWEVREEDANQFIN